MRGNLGGTGASKERIRLLQAGRAWVWLALIVYVGLWGLWSRAALAQDALCAEVKIVIEQKLSLERQAFDARMVIRNG